MKRLLIAALLLLATLFALNTPHTKHLAGGIYFPGLEPLSSHTSAA